MAAVFGLIERAEGSYVFAGSGVLADRADSISFEGLAESVGHGARYWRSLSDHVTCCCCWRRASWFSLDRLFDLTGGWADSGALMNSARKEPTQATIIALLG
jgi:hypothetical protein